MDLLKDKLRKNLTRKNIKGVTEKAQGRWKPERELTDEERRVKDKFDRADREKSEATTVEDSIKKWNKKSDSKEKNKSFMEALRDKLRRDK